MHLIRSAKCQQYQTCLRPHGEQMVGTVFDFVGPGFFVFLDLAGLIFVERTTRDDPGLAVFAGGKSVNIQRGLILGKKDALGDKFLQVFARAFKHLDRIRHCIVGKLGFRSRDPQKAKRIFIDRPPHLGPLHHIIGCTRNFLGFFRKGP